MDITPFEKDAICVMDRAYVDLAALSEINRSGAFLVIRAKQNMGFEVIETNFNIDHETGLKSDCTVVLTGPKSADL